MKKQLTLSIMIFSILLLISACDKSDTETADQCDNKLTNNLNTVSLMEPTKPDEPTGILEPTKPVEPTKSILPTQPISTITQMPSETHQSSSCITSEPELFIPIIDKNKYGLVNQDGMLLVDPVYDYMEDFSDDLALVKKDEKYGYINKKGNIAIEIQYDFAEGFSEGLAAVEISGEYGYIDKTGKVVIQPQFEQAESFSNGLARVQSLDGLWSYISKDGKTVIQTEYSLVGDFHEDRAFVQMTDGMYNTYGFIDKSGNMVIAPKNNGQTQDLPPTDFSDGFAIMKIEKDDGTIVSVYVDKEGTILGNHEYNEAYEFSNGLAYADGGFIDKTGSYVLKEKELFDGNAHLGLWFSEGLVSVRVNNKSGFIDAKGDLVIKLRYDNITDHFHNGYAVVELDQKRTYINKSGNIIWQEK